MLVHNEKSILFLAVFVILIMYSVFASVFNLPMYAPLIKPFWKITILEIVGIVFLVLASVGLIYSLVSFGNSFRVGIDKQKADKLVTTGIFKYSRNPVYVCFNLFLSGIFLVHCNILILLQGVGLP